MIDVVTSGVYNTGRDHEPDMCNIEHLTSRALGASAFLRYELGRVPGYGDYRCTVVCRGWVGAAAPGTGGGRKNRHQNTRRGQDCWFVYFVYITCKFCIAYILASVHMQTWITYIIGR
jgi:hypothetical protein